MTQQIINIGTTPGDGSGDPLRVAFDKINQNFSELYAKYQNLSTLVSADFGLIGTDIIIDYGLITDPATLFLDYGSI